MQKSPKIVKIHIRQPNSKMKKKAKLPKKAVAMARKPWRQIMPANNQQKRVRLLQAIR